MLLVALGLVRRYIHDGGTPGRYSMLLRDTGIQLLCTACGVALSFLWAPNAVLLCCTALQPCALQNFKNIKKIRTGVSILHGGVVCPGIGDVKSFLRKNILPRALPGINFEQLPLPGNTHH